MKSRIPTKNPKLVARMAEMGINNRKLSELSGLSLPTISLIITEKTINPKPETVKSICRVLDCSPESIGLEVSP